jgi:hypothetical protein
VPNQDVKGMEMSKVRRAKARTLRATEQLVAERSVLIMRTPVQTRPRHLAPTPSNETTLRGDFYDYSALRSRADVS